MCTKDLTSGILSVCITLLVGFGHAGVAGQEKKQTAGVIPIVLPKDNPSVLGIAELLPPPAVGSERWGNPGLDRSSQSAAPCQVTIVEIKGGKGKPVVLVVGNCPIQMTQIMENPSDSLGKKRKGKNQNVEVSVFIWTEGTIHTFKEPIAFANHKFEPAKDSILSFRVETSKGYVFAGGRGKVVTPSGEEVVYLTRPRRGGCSGSLHGDET